ncbi:LysR family transcriptional regulator [Microbacterium pseudoresistens]|uniref:DNA-binding transcriptional LysR family regulator n=1 Tax=Microbacterium pseudoresistens TaxID=640634 RepID=A0A7Y9JNU5_9MICO|nr:LysR family transcriptional regulator [Microbacterium pseudoresistens]NYD54923.1 DNA-binding transcriptional LysR family regulator [Microbacterium pseudoresistens]
MELRHLRYFVAVAEELHFRKAAEKLHIVQPALSKQISSLEAELGLRLLDRDRRHVTLTEAGRTFLDEAIAVLALADGAKARAIAVSEGRVGHLNMGFIQPALAGVVPRALRRYREAYPQVRIRLAELTSRRALEQVASGDVHCAFTRLPIEPTPGILHEPVSTQEVVIAVPEGHRLAERDAVNLAELADEDLILIDRRVEPQLHDYYVAQCNEAGFSPRVAQEVNSTWVSTGLVASGLGVGFVPASARIAPQKGVAFVPIEGSPAQLTMGLIWAEGAQPSVLRNFLAMRPWQKEKGEP